jgi:hypothetical protein
MKAIVFEHNGKATSILTLQEVPQPQPLEGELLIKVLASTINPADILFIAGKYRMQPNLPQIAVLEGVGVVMQQGKNTLTPTQTLVAFRHKNVWAEYVVVPEKKDNCVTCQFFERESRSVLSQSNYCIRPIIASTLATRKLVVVNSCKFSPFKNCHSISGTKKIFNHCGSSESRRNSSIKSIGRYGSGIINKSVANQYNFIHHSK